MKYKISILVILIFIGCSRNPEKMDHFYSINQLKSDFYETIDLQDSLVLLNKSSIFFHSRDTIVINPKNRTFIRAGKTKLPFYNVTFNSDTIILSYHHFYKDTLSFDVEFVRNKPNPLKDPFSESYITVDLIEYNNEKIVSVDPSKIKNIVIGEPKKSATWLSEESNHPLMEYEREMYLVEKNLDKFCYYLSTNLIDKIICLHIDKHVSMDWVGKIKSKLDCEKFGIKIIESRAKGTELVFIE